jgi:hypothetical protein
MCDSRLPRRFVHALLFLIIKAPIAPTAPAANAIPPKTRLVAFFILIVNSDCRGKSGINQPDWPATVVPNKKARRPKSVAALLVCLIAA